MTKLLIVDDHPVVLEGWERIVRSSGACHIEGVQTPLQALRAYRKDPPEMIIMDISFGENKMAGLRMIRRLRLFDKKTPILVFTMHNSPIVAKRALEAGANGFINKDSPPAEIDLAYKTVRKGESFLATDMATKVAMLNRPTPAQELGLTKRELEVLGMIAEGKAYRDIATELCVSYKTVANISYALRSKLNVQNLPSLVVKATEYFQR